MKMHSRFIQKRAVLVLASAFAMAAVALPGQAANTTTASSTGVVVKPINVTKSSDLSFGSFAAGAGGSITVSTSGARSVSGVVALNSTTTTAAKFDVDGENSTAYTIDFTGSSTTLTSAANTMAFTLVNDLTGGNTTSGTITAGTLDGTGKQSIFVGGVLTVDANQAPGSYSGIINVLVNYN